jgi:hypothetical protein
MKKMLKFSALLLLAAGVCGWDRPHDGGRCRVPADAALSFVEVARFDVPNANQGVGVDKRHFYAVDNQVITKHDKRTGNEVGRYEWQGDPAQNPLIHFDSAAVVDGKLYASHSNYSEWPMTSSVEILNADTMEHIGTHSFGILWGSLTWIDWHQGYFWGTFANYDRQAPHPDPANPGGYNVEPGQESTRTSVQQPYGYKRNTTMVKFTKDWQPVESWVLPDEILTNVNTGNMSNSGGSWGPDGFLYLTGHDPAWVHKVKLPEAGSKLVLVETIPLNRGGDLSNIDNVSIRGQGVAWDRSRCGDFYGIIRATSAERARGITHKVTVSRLQY